jgi:Tfp pilus assembly protein PilE
MGQQQLLLVILVTIIVGIATVVAINTFGSAADSANLDAVRQDVAQIAASAQGYYMKPTMLGGGGKTFTNVTFNDMSFAADSVSSNGLTALNANGLYVISGANGTQFTITAHPSSDDDYVAADGLGATATNTLSGTVTADNFTWTDSN